MSEQNQDVVRVKKYANRRLYNTATSSYVTLDYLAQMVRDGIEFTVEDAKSGDNITRQVLTQIVVDEEAKGQQMLPINFLRQLISLYGDNLQSIVPKYLEQSMAVFSSNQEQFRSYVHEIKDKFAPMFPLGPLEEMSKQHMAFFEQAVKMFSPFVPGGGQTQDDKPAEAASQTNTSRETPKAPDAAMQELKNQMQELQHQMEVLSETQKKDDKPS